jgi:hypothetical protein
MALTNPSVTNKLKSLADIAALPNQGIKALLEVFEPQNKNLFEVLLAPGELSLANAAKAALDTAITSVFCQSISMPLFSIEYARYNHEQGTFDLEYPDTITIHFLENDLSFVRIYMQKWMSDTVNLRWYSGIPGDFVFKDNQDAAKKTALVIPTTTMNLPNLCWIKIDGLRIQSIEPFSFAQTDSEPMIIAVTFAVDNVRLFSPANPFL